MERDGLASSAGAAPAPPVGRALGKSFTRRRDAAGPRAAPARLHGLQQHHLHHPVPSPLSISGYRVASPRGWRRDGRANMRKHSFQFARDETSNVKKELNRVLGTLDSCAAALEPRGGCVLPGLIPAHRTEWGAQVPKSSAAAACALPRLRTRSSFFSGRPADGQRTGNGTGGAE